MLVLFSHIICICFAHHWFHFAPASVMAQVQENSAHCPCSTQTWRHQRLPSATLYAFTFFVLQNSLNEANQSVCLKYLPIGHQYKFFVICNFLLGIHNSINDFFGIDTCNEVLMLRWIAQSTGNHTVALGMLHYNIRTTNFELISDLG